MQNIGGYPFCVMKNQSHIQPEYLKLSQLVTYSGLCRRTLWDLIRKGLPFYQKPGVKGRGGAVLVKVEDFDNFMQRYRQGRDPKLIADELLR